MGTTWKSAARGLMPLACLSLLAAGCGGSSSDGRSAASTTELCRNWCETGEACASLLSVEGDLARGEACFAECEQGMADASAQCRSATEAFVECSRSQRDCLDAAFFCTAEMLVVLSACDGSLFDLATDGHGE